MSPEADAGAATTRDGVIADELWDAIDDTAIAGRLFRADCAFVTKFVAERVEADLAEKHRKKLAAVWSRLLKTMLDDRLDDGTPVLEVVFARNPTLASRLGALISR